MKKDFYTVEEATEVLGMSKRSLEDEIRAGELKAYKRKSRWYIMHCDILAYIQSGQKAHG